MSKFDLEEFEESEASKREWEESKKRRLAARKALQEKARKQREQRIMIGAAVGILLVLLFLLISAVKSCASQKEDAVPEEVPIETVAALEEENPSVEAPVEEPVEETKNYSFTTAQTLGAIPSEVVSKYIAIIDCDTNTILGGKEIRTRMNPASMIKILTVLTAMDYVENMEDTVEITIDITDYTFTNGCSVVGYGWGDTPTVEELFYGTIVPSGADAAIALAKYCAGSQEAFVELMNEKAKELGLTDTHVTNCVGIYDENQYSTVYDIAVILRTAMDDSFLRNVLVQHKYLTAPTKDNPDGILLSNWFLRRIEDFDTHGTVEGAKTGYVDESGSCAASFATDKNGKTYLCVTSGSTTSWRCVHDHINLYCEYLPQ